MRIGTKSVLWGAHCWFLHPWFVAAAWWKLYGFPRDWRMWLCFFVHDLGYVGKPNMDGPEGESHPYWGAGIVDGIVYWVERARGRSFPEAWDTAAEWRRLVLYHSRFLAKRHDEPYSRLCVADKLALCLEPWWLYLPRVWASGELREYMALAGGRNGSKYAGEPNTKYESMQLSVDTPRSWFTAMTCYLRRWVEEHKDGREDTWTPKTEAQP